MMKSLLQLKWSRIAFAIIWDYSFLALFIGFGLNTESLALKFLLGVGIARQLHGIGVLFHDGAHYNISRNQKWNDFITDWVLGTPLFFSLQSYRFLHFRHHSHLLTEKDPDAKQYTDYPMKAAVFLTRILKYDLTGLSYVKVITYFNYPKDKSKLYFKKFYIHPLAALRGALLFAALSTVCYRFGSFADVFYLWLIPLFLYTAPMTRLRSAIEHGGLQQAKETNGISGGTRTTPSLLFRILICPHHIGYHTEHHYHPAVPFYNLPKLNRMMEEASDGKVINKYLGVASVYEHLFGSGFISIKPDIKHSDFAPLTIVAQAAAVDDDMESWDNLKAVS